MRRERVPRVVDAEALRRKDYVDVTVDRAVAQQPREIAGLQRRGRDSNPRCAERRTTVFEAVEGLVWRSSGALSASLVAAASRL
jgi:hypothetical protein